MLAAGLAAAFVPRDVRFGVASRFGTILPKRVFVGRRHLRLPDGGQ